MSSLFLGKTFSEHHQYPNGEDVSIYKTSIRDIFFQNRSDAKCVSIKHVGDKAYLTTSFYVGLDWLTEDKAIYIEPKFIGSDQKTDYLRMLCIALKHPDVPTSNLYEIKFADRQIKISHAQDLITPLLVIHFLRLLKEIVQKGLKKSYYMVERNLNSRIKGKILISKTIRSNVIQNKPLQTVCKYEEFGLNGLENRLLKKALLFVQRYLRIAQLPQAHDYSESMFNFILPAFKEVSDNIDLHEIKELKINSFYKEYIEATDLAKAILKRFGYNINLADQDAEIATPPFWIDMSKLFELYVLGLLKDKFSTDIKYHFSTHGNELDFLLTRIDMQMVIDAKYKPLYQNRLDHSDIRQLSGYARHSKVYKVLNRPVNENVECLIIYPDNEDGAETLDSDLRSEDRKIVQYVGFYRFGIKLPMIP